jgi:hypothetical protein
LPVAGSRLAAETPLLLLGVLIARHAEPPFGIWEALDVPAPVLMLIGTIVASLGAAAGTGARFVRRSTT